MDENNNIPVVAFYPRYSSLGYTDEEKAEVARLSSFVGAMAIGDLVKSTLGPKGMDKILWGMGRNEGEVEVTNDGATILKAIGVDNPAAKILVDASRVQVRVQQRLEFQLQRL